MRVERLGGQALGFSRPTPDQPSTAGPQGQTAAHTDLSDRALQLGVNFLAEVLLSGRGGLVLTALLEPLAPQTHLNLSTAVAPPTAEPSSGSRRYWRAPRAQAVVFRQPDDRPDVA